MTKLLPMMNGNLDPVRASEARAVDAPLPLHHHAFKTHEGTGFHQPRTFLGGEGFGEFHGVRLERVLKLPKNRMPLFQRPIEQRVAVHMQAIKDHVAEMARKLPVPGSKAGLQRLEVRLALVVDDDDFPIQKQRGWESPERIRNRPEEVREGVPVARHHTHGAIPDMPGPGSRPTSARRSSLGPRTWRRPC